jgi:tetratricopeptide (TPR) repeat protein
MEEAFTNLNRAIEIESRNTLAIFFRSRIENESSLFGIYRGTTIAIHSLTLALDIDVKFIAAYLYRGAIKSSKANRHIHEYGRPQIEDYLDAIHDFDSALSLDSTIAGAYYSRGKLRAVIKDYQGAVDDFSFALKFNFTRPKEIFFKRGQMRSKLGDKDGANQDFERAKNLKFV